MGVSRIKKWVLVLAIIEVIALPYFLSHFVRFMPTSVGAGSLVWVLLFGSGLFFGGYGLFLKDTVVLLAAFIIWLICSFFFIPYITGVFIKSL
jgi:hypothetical protein